MKEKLDLILKNALSEFNDAKSIQDLDEVKLKYLSRKGELNSIKKNLKDLSDEDKRVVGAFANNVYNQLDEQISTKGEELYKVELNKKLEAEKIDITLPSDFRPQGKVHPLTQTVNEIVEIFQGLGFTVMPSEFSTEVETEYINFDMLNFPPDHPAKDMQDTFYTKVAPNVILRSQTSGAQIHEMLNKKPPIRVVSPGRVYRCESVSERKNNLFHQIEGLLVDKDITFADLKGTLQEFAVRLFGEGTKVKFRPHHFQFTEPSAEMDVSCFKCGGKGCRFCKGSGWVEILGCGMVHPHVLEMSGIDPEEYTGFAFGIGLERITLFKYEIDDMRLLYENDTRFLKQI